jgi:FlaA1/EpsC-like NDP-sugar epimerase
MTTKEKRPSRIGTLPRALSRHRIWLAGLANVIVIAAAYVGAFLLRFDLTLPQTPRTVLLNTLPAALVVQYAAFHWFKLTRGWWRYVGLADFLNAIKAAAVSAFALAAYVMLFDRSRFPRSVFFLNAMLVIGLSIGLRLMVRVWRQLPAVRTDRKRLLIVGAGDTGEALLREIRNSDRLPYVVVAFLDDDPAKQGAYINGVPVVDGVAAVGDTVQEMHIDEIIVATPSASGDEMRDIIAQCRAAGVPFKVMPATWEVLHGRATLGEARAVDIHDLLRRPAVELDLAGIGKFLEGKRVLVTGAAGSIGSEICNQVLRFSPRTLLCVDHDENALFFLERQLLEVRPDGPIQMVLADVTDRVRMERLFAQHRPEIIYHAAAHKHVPIVEGNPVEGVRNNVFGTETVASLAGEYGASAFVLISSDKAVNPTSVMGASKRIAELLIRSLNHGTRYCAVRFGNVLGSQGSVVPIFKKQIADGGPVMVTHPDMSRYFMTIPEAVELVLQASAMGEGYELFMLEMGDPVKIVDLAHDLIILSGLRPGIDIQIAYSGIRPGEKLMEELYFDHEVNDRTSHPKIHKARHGSFDTEQFGAQIEQLREAVDSCDDGAIRRMLPLLIPEFQGAISSASDDAKIIPLPLRRGGGS